MLLVLSDIDVAKRATPFHLGAVYTRAPSADNNNNNRLF